MYLRYGYVPSGTLMASRVLRDRRIAVKRMAESGLLRSPSNAIERDGTARTAISVAMNLTYRLR